MKHDEADLQIRCVNFLTYRYAHTYPVHCPNEGKRTDRQGAYLRKLGMKPGFPDLMIISDRDSKYPLVFVEFKTKTGRQSPEQKNSQKILEGHGWVYVICRDYFEFMEICHKYLGPERDPDLERLREILNT